MNRLFILFITIIPLLISCKNEIKDLKNFDTNKWKNDKDGCNGERQKLYNQLISQESKLQGHTQEEIKDLLGAPDKNDLMERGQKQFIYFIDNGPSCQNKKGATQGIYLRFSALNNLYEISVQ